MKWVKGERNVLRLTIVLVAVVGLATAGVGMAGSEPEPVVIAGVKVPANVPYALENGGVKDLAIPLELVKSCFTRINGVKDYTCLFLREERIKNKIEPLNYIMLKVRHKPFSIYMKWIAPGAHAGREVLYVQGQNDGKMIIHDDGIAGAILSRISLAPDDNLVKDRSRHPVTHAGILNMTRRLKDRWGAELKIGETQVWTSHKVKVAKRPVWFIKTLHPDDPKLSKVRGGRYMFYKMHLFVDKEHLLPIRLEGYDWFVPAEQPGPLDILRKPQPASKDLPMLCKYTYLDLKFNVGLTDKDFDWRNPDYAFR